MSFTRTSLCQPPGVCRCVPHPPDEGSVRPEERQLELDGIEGLGADPCFLGEGGDEQPVTCLQWEDVERAREWIHVPHVPHAFPGVDAHLRPLVHAPGPLRKHLAHPVRRKIVVRRSLLSFQGIWHALASPPREVRHELVRTRAEVEFRLIEDDPSTGTASPQPEGPSDEDAQTRGRAGMGPGGTRTEVKLTREDFRDHLRGSFLEGLLHGRGVALGGLGWGVSGGHAKRFHHDPWVVQSQDRHPLDQSAQRSDSSSSMASKGSARTRASWEKESTSSQWLPSNRKMSSVRASGSTCHT